MSPHAASVKSPLSSLPTDVTIAGAIRLHAETRPRHAAILASGFPPYSYGELARHLDTTAAALREAGLSRSSRIAILLPSGPELALAGISVAANGAAVPCNPNLSPVQIQALLARLQVDGVVLPAWIEAPAWIEERSGDLAILRAARAEQTLAQALIACGGRRKAKSGTSTEPAPEDPALILQTSGTIGPPKLVPVSHRNLMAMAKRMEQCFELSHLDRCACLLPLYYAQGIKSGCIVPLLLGGSIALPQAPVLDNLESWLAQLQPTWFPAGPAFLQAVLERVRGSSAGQLEHNLRFLISGSASLPEQLRAGIESALGIPLLDAWGMTEIGLLTGNSIRPAGRKPGTVGYAFPDEVAIAAPDGRLRARSETGEVVVRGPAVMNGYIADEEANRTAFVDGWFHTGDLGSIDADGFLTLTGRIKEIINRGGEKISPDLVERALRSHPAVKEVAAFAIPHARLGEDVAAAVVPGSEATVSSAELQAFLTASLPQAMIPRSIVFVTALPKGPTGKVRRKELSASWRPAEDRVIVPPQDEMESKLLALWRRLLQRNDIGVEDDFFGAGGDSLLAAQMLLDAEKITRKLLRQRALPVPATIRALARGIADAAPLEERLLLTRITGEASGVPFFYCHGDYMFGGRYAYRLAELLGGKEPVYLLNNHDLSERPHLPTIEELASAYVPSVLAAQPSGPLRLGGHCNGGLMAMELARQLCNLGRRVELLVLIEPFSLNARPAFRCAGYLLDAMIAAIPRKTRLPIRSAIMYQLWRSFRWTCERLGFNSPSEDDPASWADEPKAVKKIYQQLMSNYIPPRIPMPIVCITAQGSSRAVEFDWRPWRRLSPAVTMRVIPGTHISCLTTYVDSLARTLRETLSGPAAAGRPKSARNGAA